MGALRRLRGAAEVRAFTRLLLVAPLFPALLRLPLPLVSRILIRCRWPLRPGIEPQRVAAVVEAAQVFAHPLVRRGCLTRGLSLFWLLPGDSAELRVCFGLGDTADDFAGHCWLERAGVPYLEKVDPRPRFAEQFTIPPRAAAGGLTSPA